MSEYGAMRGVGRFALAFALLLATAASAHAQAVRGRVIDEETGAGVPEVRVRLLNASGTRVGEVITDSVGVFAVAGRGAGSYTIEVSHIAYEDHRTPEFEIPLHEIVSIDVRVARNVIPLDPISVVARVATDYHAPTYDGLYARMQQMPVVGTNRIVMKNDMEFRSAIEVGDLLRRFFPGMMGQFSRLCNPTYYWNGHQINQRSVDMYLRTSVENLEAIEVYDDFLIAPLSMRDPPDYRLDRMETQPCAVIAMWAVRPDLPGRKH